MQSNKVLTINFVNGRCTSNTMILVFKHLFYKNYVGLTFWPFIILKNDSLKEDDKLINHRSLWYLSFYRGYQNISFEQEAYHNEHNLNYPRERKAFSFIKYL